MHFFSWMAERHELYSNILLTAHGHPMAQGLLLKAFGNWRAKFKAERSRCRASCSIGAAG
jgi:hypothetical protein